MPRPSRVRDERDFADEVQALRNRDYVMARLGAAIAGLDGAKESVLEALTIFVTPADDPKGRDRMTAIDDAIEAASIATRSLECAVDMLRKDSSFPVDLDAGEPWEEEDDDPDGAD